MLFLLEAKKIKHTGYLAAFLLSGIISCIFPIIHMLVRAETFTSLPGNPYVILINANWKMMTMFNILIVICGACIMYHTEYANSGMLKMVSLPVNSIHLFFSKFLITALLLAGIIFSQITVLVGCALHWFSNASFDFISILKNTGFQWLIFLPTTMLMLFLSSVCKNMWISLGIGIIMVFTVSIFPQDNFAVSLFPFCSPYQTLAVVDENSHTQFFCMSCIIQTILFYLAEVLYLKTRRSFT